MSQLAAPNATIRRTRPGTTVRAGGRTAPGRTAPARQPAARPQTRTKPRATPKSSSTPRATSRPVARAARGRTRVAAVPRANSRFGFVLLAVAFASLLALLLLNTARAEQSVTIGRLSSDVTTLENRSEALSSELDAVSAPEELAARAQKLGMRHASAIIYKDKATGKTLGVAGSSQAGADINLNTLPNTPASKAAAALLSSASVGLHIDDPVARARAEAKSKAEAAAKDRADKAKQQQAEQDKAKHDKAQAHKAKAEAGAKAAASADPGQAQQTGKK